MSDWKTEFLKAALMLVVVAYEWWAMQPYHEPVLAKLWFKLAQFCYGIARRFGMLGICAEHKYFQAV